MLTTRPKQILNTSARVSINWLSPVGTGKSAGSRPELDVDSPSFSTAWKDTGYIAATRPRTDPHQRTPRRRFIGGQRRPPALVGGSGRCPRASKKNVSKTSASFPDQPAAVISRFMLVVQGTAEEHGILRKATSCRHRQKRRKRRKSSSPHLSLTATVNYFHEADIFQRAANTTDLLPGICKSQAKSSALYRRY